MHLSKSMQVSNEYRIEFNGRAIILNYEFKFSAENWLKRPHCRRVQLNL